MVIVKSSFDGKYQHVVKVQIDKSCMGYEIEIEYKVIDIANEDVIKREIGYAIAGSILQALTLAMSVLYDDFIGVDDDVFYKMIFELSKLVQFTKILES